MTTASPAVSSASAPSTTTGPTGTLQQQLIGNCFGSPALEYLLIGSVWSIGVVLLLLGPPIRALLLLLVVGNSAHFAAYTERLFTKPSFRGDYPSISAIGTSSSSTTPANSPLEPLTIPNCKTG